MKATRRPRLAHDDRQELEPGDVLLEEEAVDLDRVRGVERAERLRLDAVRAQPAEPRYHPLVARPAPAGVVQSRRAVAADPDGEAVLSARERTPGVVEERAVGLQVVDQGPAVR